MKLREFLEQRIAHHTKDPHALDYTSNWITAIETSVLYCSDIIDQQIERIEELEHQVKLLNKRLG